jgi:DNA-binding IscR family transcriptional regulator
MAFQGSLKELPLPDIIQLVSVSGKTGKFTLTRESERGLIYLRGGQMVHAESGELIGEEAIYALAIWNSGDFQFAAGEEPQQQTITKSNTNLLMEAARRLDEWRVLSKKVPSVEMVPELMARENRHEQITLNPQEWLLVTRINGHRSVADIGQLLGISAFDVAKVLYGLVTSELVQLKKKVDGGNELIELAARIRVLVEQHIGPGHKSIDRNFRAAVEAISAGDGMRAIRTMVQEFEKTASLLRGTAVTEQLRAEIGSITSLAS